MKRTPAILIGMDATEVELLDQLVDEGRMPTIAAMREEGAWGRLKTWPDAFLSMVWPTFSAAQDVSKHGWYFNKLWRPDRQRLEYASPEWLPQNPFWHHLDPKCRIALLDIPFAHRPPLDLNGVFLNGWQNHDDFGRYTRPASLWNELKRRLGPPALKPELFGHQSVRTLLDQRRQVLEATRQFGELCEHVLEMENWDLLVAIFGAAHRGGHYLWDLSQVDTSEGSAHELQLLHDSRAEMYEAWDRALGRILEKAPADARVMVFSLHGMAPNPGWAEHFATMVNRVRSGGETTTQKSGLAYRVKKALPWSLVRQITTRMPTAINHAVVPIWSRRMYDWQTTRFFPLPLDLNGYVRINLRGRETEGIVAPGAEYEALLAELEEALPSFGDLETGQPVVSHVERTDDLVGSDAPARYVLPDLVAHWSQNSSVTESSGISSEQYGDIRWGVDRRLPSGRSGNHSPRGWFVAVGEGVSPGEVDRVPDTVELVPTALEWIGQNRPDSFQGRPMPELTAQASESTSS